MRLWPARLSGGLQLGGGLAGYGEKLLAPLRRRIEKETFRGDTNTELVLASLGNDAGLVGAAML